jgi:signal transduction histidine kinase
VSVRDTGMGISLRDQEQVFERFHRVGDSMTPSTPGAGLGLYICRAIVEAHGGRIWVESTLREGSTFSFSLPREEKAHLPMVVF